LSDLISALDDLARDLRRDAALIPLQRRMRRCCAGIAAVLETGLPVRALASELVQRGVTNRSDRPLAYGHLRVLLARLDAPQAGKSTNRSIAASATDRRTEIVGTAGTSKSVSGRPDFSYGLFKTAATDEQE
jgi:hypothetical protein